MSFAPGPQDPSPDDPGPGVAGLERRQLLLLSGATALGLGVRIWAAAGAEIWLDESYSVLLAIAPLREMAADLAVDSSPPLYYLVLKAWTILAPFHAFWLRVPSLLLGTATIPAIWFVGKRVDTPRAGLAAAWLLAVHPLHVHYSEEIRMYALLALLGLAFYFALFHVLPRSGRVLPAALAGLGLAYTHYYVLVMAGAGLLLALALLPGFRRKVLGCGGIVAAGFLPWLPVFWRQLGNPNLVGWMASFWEAYPRGAAVFRSLQAFLPGGAKYAFVPLDGLSLPGLGEVAGASVFQVLLLAFALAPFAVLALKPERRRLLAPSALPLAVAVATLLVIVARSYLASPVYLAGRSDVVVLPLFLLGLALALARLGPRARLLFLSVWVALSGLELGASAESLRRPGNEEIAAAVDGAGCTRVVATGLAYVPTLIYQMLADDGAQVLPFPIDMGTHPGNIDPARYTPASLARDARILAETYPPGPGLCVLGATAHFQGPLAEAYRSAGGEIRQVGVFHASLTAGTPFVLVEVGVPGGAAPGGSEPVR
jgi:hypothetical protein